MYFMKYAAYLLSLETRDNVQLLENTEEYLICKSCKGPSNSVRLPKEITPQLAYFVGVIYGDGWITSKVNRIGLDKGNLLFFEEVYLPLLKALFGLELKITKAHRSWRVSFKSRIIWDLLIHVFEVSANKARTARIPAAIKSVDLDIQRQFLAGLLDTDGGSRQGSFGFTTASVELNEDVIALMHTIEIPLRRDTWFNKKVNRQYYGFVVNKRNCPLILEQIPLKNQKRLLLLDNICRGAGVVK